MMYVYSSEGNESPMKDCRTPCADCGEVQGEGPKPLKLKPYFSDHGRKSVFPEGFEIMVEGPPPTEENIRSWYPDCDEAWVYAIQEQVALTKGFMPSDEEQFTAVALRAERIRAGNGTPLVGCFGPETTAAIEAEYGPGEPLYVCTLCGSPCGKTSVGGACSACSVEKERVELERDFEKQHAKHLVEERAERIGDPEPCPACNGSKREAQAGCDSCFSLFQRSAAIIQTWREWATSCAPTESPSVPCLACGEVTTTVFPDGACNACASKWLEDVMVLERPADTYVYKDSACTFDSWAEKQGPKCRSKREAIHTAVQEVILTTVSNLIQKTLTKAALEISADYACGCGHDALDPKDQTGIHESYCGKS